jgi:N-acetylmuramoyl-L-alanine amidase
MQQFKKGGDNPRLRFSPWPWCLGFIGACLVSLPAEAARLQFWRFDQTRNQLEFRTEADVQPQAQLIANPTRLVIDLPGIKLGRPSVVQNLTGHIRAVRVAQFDPETTRIVVELAPGYTLDPEQVRFRGASATRWFVQLPQPQAVEINSVKVTSPPSWTQTSQLPRFSPPGQTPASKVVTDLQVTPDGLFVSTPGTSPQVALKRSRNKKRVEIELQGVTLAATFKQKRYTVNRFGISQLEITQLDPSAPGVRLTLQVDEKSPDFLASVSSLGGVAIVPKGGSSTFPNRPQAPLSLVTGNTIAQPVFSVPSNLAMLQDLDLGSDQLLIRLDRTTTYTVRWEGTSYRITLRSTQLSDQIQPPRLGYGSPLSQISLQQVDPQTISILVTPAPGVRIMGVKRLDAQSMLLQLYRPGGVTPPPLNQQFPSIDTNRFPNSQQPLPIPSGRRVVVIDPGHGGPDPGAIGIGGIREKDIVIDISREVARILQQQGVYVRLTRSDDRDLDLAPRVAIAERANADVFLSIHANAISMARPDINGVETFYGPGRTRSGRLAEMIQNSILSTFNMRNRGVKAARFYVIRNTSMPSALVEVGFVTGQEDAPNLSNPAWRRQMAQAISRGILQYLNSGG